MMSMARSIITTEIREGQVILLFKAYLTTLSEAQIIQLMIKTISEVERLWKQLDVN
jgi:hypothetical protein